MSNLMASEKAPHQLLCPNQPSTEQSEQSDAGRADIDWVSAWRFRAPEENLSYLLWQIMQAWKRHVSLALAQSGLTHLQTILLLAGSYLAREGPVSQVKLASFCAMEPMLVSKVLRTLEKKGLITRKTDLRDSRVKLIAPTRNGLMTLQHVLPLLQRVYDDFFKPLGSNYEAVQSSLLGLFRTLETSRRA